MAKAYDPRPQMADQMVSAIGLHGSHGISASFDFLEALSSVTTTSSSKDSEEEPPLRILLVHPGDIRHILTTLSRRRRHANNSSRLRPIHFYLLEHPIEMLGRDLLTLEIIFDFEVPIRQRAAVYLEVFGNCYVQERTARYIERLGHEMRDLINNQSGRLEDIVDLSLLKYSQRDHLETVFRSYAFSNEFDMAELRDHRLRGFYTDRYDQRKALADYDYYNTLKSYSSIVHVRQYRDWRLGGIGFELGDQIYSEGNRTLMSYAEGMMKKGKDAGLKKKVKGFWGDVVNGPYYSYGCDVDSRMTSTCPDHRVKASKVKDGKERERVYGTIVSSVAGTGAQELHKVTEGLFEIMNKNTGTEQHRHHVVEVSMYNLLSMLWEVETGKPYFMNKEHDVYSGLGAEAGFKEDQVTQAMNEKRKDAQMDALVDESSATDLIYKGSEDPLEEEEKVLPPLPPVEEGEEGEEGEKEAAADGEKEEKGESDDNGDDDDEALLAKEIERAECIIASVDEFKVFPLVGQPAKTVYHSKYINFFDAAFVSSRAAGIMGQSEFGDIMKTDALLCTETAKHMVTLNKDQRVGFSDKILEMCVDGGFVRVSEKTVVPRRRRDDEDKYDDVLFFTKK